MTSRHEVLNRLTTIFHDTFDDDQIILLDSTAAADIEEWDSLNHITLVLAIEREFSVHLSAVEVGTLANVGEMIDLLMARASKYKV